MVSRKEALAVIRSVLDFWSPREDIPIVEDRANLRDHEPEHR